MRSLITAILLVMLTACAPSKTEKIRHAHEGMGVCEYKYRLDSFYAYVETVDEWPKGETGQTVYLDYMTMSFTDVMARNAELEAEK